MGYIKRTAIAKYQEHQSTAFLLSIASVNSFLSFNPTSINPEIMVRVAIAGGTSGLGRLVVNAITATKKHDVFVLSRKVVNRLLNTLYLSLG